MRIAWIFTVFFCFVDRPVFANDQAGYGSFWLSIGSAEKGGNLFQTTTEPKYTLGIRGMGNQDRTWTATYKVFIASTTAKASLDGQISFLPGSTVRMFAYGYAVGLCLNTKTLLQVCPYIGMSAMEASDNDSRFGFISSELGFDFILGLGKDYYAVLGLDLSRFDHAIAGKTQRGTDSQGSVGLGLKF